MSSVPSMPQPYGAGAIFALPESEIKLETADDDAVIDSANAVDTNPDRRRRRAGCDGDKPTTVRKKKSKMTPAESAAAAAHSGEAQICSVCGDFASGFHYSALTCEACKSFFKRTVQDKHEYTCSGNFDCAVSKSMRKSCQYCRFQKCLRNGMLPQDVRMDRTRGGRKKCKRTSREQFDQLVERIAVAGGPAVVAEESSPPLRRQPQQAQLSPAVSVPTPSPRGASSGTEKPSGDPLESFIREALASDWISRPLQIHPTPLSHADMHSALNQWFERGLESVVAWSNSLSCLDVLLLQDRIALLTKNWFAVLLMDTLSRSLPFDGGIHFATNLSLRPADAALAQLPADFFSTIHGMFESLDQLQLERSELSMLKLMTLLDHSIVDDMEVICRSEPLRSSTLRSLYRVCSAKIREPDDSDACDLYVSKLLLRQGFCVNLKMGLESWRSLEPPTPNRCSELIAAGLGIDCPPPVPPVPQPQPQLSPEDDATSTDSCPDQFRSRVYYKAMRLGAGPPTPGQGPTAWFVQQPSQQQQQQQQQFQEDFDQHRLMEQYPADDASFD
ncbi:hypothetical protein BOX15_Mlig009098g1 [Macrostomum lignano]|uniref:Nuclear receptor domain-containing protein n=1 Tax=Macrostomum lignano TaxID=282301 RepID=A0A267DS71_9PLAT|nr:hypothetical protein BOX15_Mlig009098g1 [Macrostomum lignano]